MFCLEATSFSVARRNFSKKCNAKFAPRPSPRNIPCIGVCVVGLRTAQLLGGCAVRFSGQTDFSRSEPPRFTLSGFLLPASVREHHAPVQLRAIAHAQLLPDPLPMRFRRRHAQRKFPGDRPRAHAAPNQAKDLQLAVQERRSTRCASRSAWRWRGSEPPHRVRWNPLPEILPRFRCHGRHARSRFIIFLD